MLIPCLRHSIATSSFAVNFQPSIRYQVVPVDVFEILEARSASEYVQTVAEMVQGVTVHARRTILWSLTFAATLEDLRELLRAKTELPQIIIIFLAYVGTRPAMNEYPIPKLTIETHSTAHSHPRARGIGIQLTGWFLLLLVLGG